MLELLDLQLLSRRSLRYSSPDDLRRSGLAKLASLEAAAKLVQQLLQQLRIHQVPPSPIQKLWRSPGKLQA